MRKKIITNTDQRPFSMIYHDFLKSGLLNHYQIVIYIYLKMFADSNNQCYPSVKTLSKLTKIGVTKVKSTIKELEQMHLITVEHRTRPDGGKSSNLYTIHDFKELWTANNSEEAAAAIEEHEENKLISMLEAKGYKVIKEKEFTSDTTTTPIETTSDTATKEKETMHEKVTTAKKSVSEENIEIKKEPISAPSKVTDIDTNNKLKINDTTQTAESQVQPSERYTLDQIHQHFDYETLIQNPHYAEERIDSVMSILYTALNTTKPTIRINGEDKPSKVVISKLMKLNMMDIEYSIDKFKEQTERINNPTAYMLTILYNSKEQAELDFTNMVEHDMYYGTLAQSSKKTAEQLFNQQENYNQNKPEN